MVSKSNLAEQGYIPLDKSWVIRMGVLDLVNGCKEDSISFLKSQKVLGDDLMALLRILERWDTDQEIEVGESGTLYRFLKFVVWKLGLDKKFRISGTLKDRSICDDPRIIDYSIKQLLELDGGTSQWASASVLFGNDEVIERPPYKLSLTYQAVTHWKNQKGKGEHWLPRYDETILNQAEAFLKMLDGEKIEFIPEQAEDYCFARVFGFITKEEGEKLWPSLRNHESDRIVEVETEIARYEAGNKIKSKDHRVVQSIAMKGKIDGRKVDIESPNAVNKSWPEFWDFLKEAQILSKSL